MANLSIILSIAISSRTAFSDASTVSEENQSSKIVVRKRFLVRQTLLIALSLSLSLSLSAACNCKRHKCLVCDIQGVESRQFRQRSEWFNPFIGSYSVVACQLTVSQFLFLFISSGIVLPVHTLTRVGIEMRWQPNINYPVQLDEVHTPMAGWQWLQPLQHSFYMVNLPYSTHRPTVWAL